MASYMATVKATFTLDEATADRLAKAAKRLGRPKSAIVREAIEEFSQRTDRLGESERRRRLQAFDELVERIPARPESDVDHELDEIRAARRGGGRGSRTDR